MPENSTHLMQPLDVSVFAPMKREWRKVLGAWKEECEGAGTNYATVPKQAFPRILRKLLKKDYSKAIISGFECTGLFPLNPARALSKLPVEDREVETHVQQQLLDKLSAMRYNPGPNTHAQRPKKADKLPPGASYTCKAKGKSPAVRPSGDSLRSSSSSSSETGSDSDHDSESDSSETENSASVRASVNRLSLKVAVAKKKRLAQEKSAAAAAERRDRDLQVDVDSEEEVEGLAGQQQAAATKSRNVPVLVTQEKEKEGEEIYLPGVFVVALYAGDWFVGQVLNKKEEPEADEREDYLLLNFMEKMRGDVLKWPSKVDHLNMLKVSQVIYRYRTYLNY